MKRLTLLAASLLATASFGQGWTGDVATLTPSAANISFQQGLGTLAVQANSVTASTPIFFGPSLLAPNIPTLVPGTTFSIGRPYLLLSRPAVLVLNYGTRSLPVGAVEGDLRIYRLDNHKWGLVGGVVNTANKTVTTSINRGGTYAILSSLENTANAEDLLVQAHSPGGSSYLMHDWFRVSTLNLFLQGAKTVETVGRSIERNLPTTVSPAYNALFDARKEPSGFWEIYSRNADSSHPIRLTNIGAERIVSLSVSGDGRRLAFSALVGGLYRIYTMNADGSNLMLITSAVPLFGGDPPVAVSPSGTQFSYGTQNLVRVFNFSTGILLRTIILPPPSTTVRGLAYNAAGSTLAVTTNAGLYSVGATTGLPTLLDASVNYGRNVCWSPDGTRIAVRYQNQIDLLRLSPTQWIDGVFDGDFGDNATFNIAWR